MPKALFETYCLRVDLINPEHNTLNTNCRLVVPLHRLLTAVALYVGLKV